MTTILIIGAADTGRAPMAAALLRRRIAAQNIAWEVGSAGVLGHDDDGPETEARDAMAALGLDIGEHRARSVSDELCAGAALLVAVDSGTAMVLRARFAAAAPRTHTLGELAGKQRDIPDPFRMQIGAWMGYARELDGLLRDALPRMIALTQPTTNAGDEGSGVRGQGSGGEQEGLETQNSKLKTQNFSSQQPGDEQEGGNTQNSKLKTQNSSRPPSPRQETVARMERLLTVAAEQPDVVRWDTARAQIEAGIAQAATPLSADDLALAYAGVLRAALALSANPPTDGQLAALRAALGVLRAPVAQESVTAWSGRLAGWAGL